MRASVLLLAVGAMLRAAQAQTEQKPNLVIFLADDHSAVDSSVYGGTDVRTPNMERLAKTGMVFERAYAASPTCAPSRATILTGLMPARNGAEPNHAKPRADVKKLPAYLQELGYEVVAFGKVAHYKTTIDYGFDHFEHDGFHEDIAIPEAIKWLRARKSGKPLCIFFGTNWPHVPWPKTGEGYNPDDVKIPEIHLDTPRTRMARARYYAAIGRMDKELGEVYDTAKQVLGDNTVFVETADQGAQWPFGKWNCYDYGLRVSMIVSWPGRIRPGTRTQAMVSLIDLLPTLVELGGGVPPKDIDGRSFVPVLKNPETPHRDRIFATHTGDGPFNIYPIRSLQSGNWKYIHNLHPEYYFSTHDDLVQPDNPSYFNSWRARVGSDPKALAVLRRYHQRSAEELYDLGTDPWEMHNLAAEPAQAGRVAAMRDEVETWMKEQGDQKKVYRKPRLLSDPDRAVPPPPGS